MEKGLTTQEVVESQKVFGENEITTTQPISTSRLLLSQFPTLINSILLCGALFSFLIKEPLDAIFILAVLLLNALLGFFQEYRAEKALQKLKDFAEPVSIVIRDGKAQELPARNIVVGDIVILNEGDRVPADGDMLSSTHIEIDESILTGESIPVAKILKQEVFRGTFIARGKGYMQVTKIGKETKLGQIAQTLSSVTDEATPLQKQITQLARVLSFCAIGIALLLLPIGIFEKKEIYPLLLLIISIAVAAIPESLPAVITIALSLGTSRMAQQKAIVRKLSSIETIGAVQIILTDKTGTLTQNDMRVKNFYVKEERHLHQLIHACIVGNTAHIVTTSGEKQIIGDKTDGALLLWADSREKEPNQKEEILDEYTFDPITKTITTVAKLHDKPFVVVRGAPESILNMCILTQKEKKELEEKYSDFAKEGLRVIALANKQESQHKTKSKKELESDLTFLGFLCLYDPPRKEARQAVLEAKNAGIRVIMVTGDNPLTAQAIAKDVGILDRNTSVLTGKDMAEMSDRELTEALKDVNVFARTTPENKMRLVTLLQNQGYIVGVTGDGVNDALALKKANVGLAMGQKGTDVAKEASDIVLADDNFATIMEAVKEGRRIYTNIVNAIVYLVTGNLSELLVILFASMLGLPNPLLPTQILWINLVTDGLPALAIATDKKGRMYSHPRKKEEPILTKNRLLFVLVGGIIITVVLLAIFNYVDNYFSLIQARTITFGLMVLFQMILAVLVRGKAIFSNKFFYATILITILLQILITVVPFFQAIFHTSL